MTRVSRAVSFLAAFALLAVSAGGCGDNHSPGRMGAAGPPPTSFRTVPFGYNPSVTGLRGAKGEVVYENGGANAWIHNSTSDTDWSSFPPGVATPSTAGLVSAAQAAALASGGLPVAVYQLDIDMTTIGDKGIVIPAVAGRFFIPRIYAVQVRSLTGTASGTAPTISFGIPGAFTSYNAATALLTAAQINVGPGATVAANNGVSPILGVANTDIHAAVGTAVTGATVLVERLLVSGFWTDF